MNNPKPIKQKNVIVTAVSIPADLLPKLNQRVRELKAQGACFSRSDYIVRRVREDLAAARIASQPAVQV